MRNGPFITGIADEAAKSIDDQIACHQSLGWRHMELRSIDAVPLARLDAGKLDATCAALAEAQFDVPVIDSQIGNWSRTIADPFENDLVELNLLLGIAKRTGTTMIRVMSYPNARIDPWEERAWSAEVVRRLRTLASIAGDEGVILVHENCAGWGGSSIDTAVRLLEAVDSPHFRMLFDIGNGLSYGYSAMECLQKLLPWIAHVHLKDGQVDGDCVKYSMPGEGEAEMLQCLRYLAQHCYRGAYAIEPHLHMIPHLNIQPGDSAAMRDTYVDYANRTQALLDQAASEMREVQHAL